jgi:ATP-dependent Clp protease ATP-binding subunit ClpB
VAPGAPVTVDDLMPDIRQFFRIEFVNRIDEIIVFQSLAKEELVKIAELRFRDLGRRLRERGIEAEITQAAARAIAEKSYDPHYGARPINRYIQTHLENPQSRMLIAGELKSGDRLKVDYGDNAFAFKTEAGTINASPAGKPGSNGTVSDDSDVEDAVYTEVD